MSEQVIKVKGEATFSVDDALEAVGYGKFQHILLVLSGLGFCATTVELILAALLKAPLRSEWQYVTEARYAWLSSATFAGELIGGLIWGPLSDRLGRRKTFVGTALMAAVFGMLGAAAPCFFTFTLSRCMLGIAIGGCLSIDVIYFVEFIPPTARGFRAAFVILMGTLGFFYVALVGWLTLPKWRLFIFCCGAPYGLLFVGRLVWPWESPRFLQSQGRHQEAHRVLQAMADTNKRALPSGYLNVPGAEDRVQGPRKTIFRRKLLRPLASISFIIFGQSFAFYALTLWLRNFASAKNIVGLDPIHSFVLIGLVELPGLAMTMSVIERLGRRVALSLNLAGSAALSALLLLTESRWSYLAVSSSIYFFIVGTWATIYISAPEIFPTSCRSTAFGFAGTFGKIAGFLSPIVFGRMWEGGVSLTTIVFLISADFLAAALVAALFLPETRGKPLSDD